MNWKNVGKDANVGQRRLMMGGTGNNSGKAVKQIKKNSGEVGRLNQNMPGVDGNESQKVSTEDVQKEDSSDLSIIDPGLQLLKKPLTLELVAGGVSSSQAEVMVMEKWRCMGEEEKQAWRIRSTIISPPGTVSSKKKPEEEGVNLNGKRVKEDAIMGHKRSMSHVEGSRKNPDPASISKGKKSEEVGELNQNKAREEGIASQKITRKDVMQEDSSGSSIPDPGLQLLKKLLTLELKANGMSSSQAEVEVMERLGSMGEEEKQAWRLEAVKEREEK